MSVTIHYRPTSKIDPHFKSGTSSDLSALENAFGDVVGPEHIPALRAMGSLRGDAHKPNSTQIIGEFYER